MWLVNHHALVPSKDGGTGRHLNMARYLPQHGWTASLIIASTIHANGSQGMKGIRLRKISNEDGVPILWVRATAYGQSMLRRFIGMLVFALVALMPGITRGLQRPDVVVGSTVHLLGAWVGLRLAKRHKVPFIYEIRDVWPDALIHLGRLTPSHPMARVMEYLSVKLAQRATIVIAPLPNIDRYLKDHSVDPTKFVWVSNGFDGARELTLPTYSPGSEFVFMYLGAHGNANALDGILEAFDRACSSAPGLALRLRLVGDGPLKPSLIKFAESLSSADRISFEEQIPSADVIGRAREADCLVSNLHDSPVYDYGISPNKLYTYMYACRPVVFACSAPNNPIREGKSGLVVAGDDREALSHAMLEIAQMPVVSRIELARRGYEHVLDNYSHEALAARFAAGLDRAVYADHSKGDGVTRG